MDWDAPPHTKSQLDVLSILGVTLDTGLSTSEAAHRLRMFGPNLVQQGVQVGLWRILWRQFASPMIILLLAVVIISLGIQRFLDAAIIAAILLVNTAIGFFQEMRAEKAMQSIRSLSVPEARVKRDGHVVLRPSGEVVPGDIIYLEAGDRIPADLRFLHAAALQVDESSLTGESIPVYKDIVPLGEANLPVGDQCNMGFMGTHVLRGRGEGVCVRTGRATVIGEIAQFLTSHKAGDVPLKQRMEKMTHHMVIAAFFLCLIILLLGVWQGEPLVDMLLATLSLGIAAIPEGLPAVITISLSLGALRLARRGVLVRNLQAVEALGSVTVICADKTGTLTENRMTVQTPSTREAVATPHFLEALVLCNDAHYSPTENTFSGDPMEVALLQFVEETGCNVNLLRKEWPRIGEIPFDTARKYMTTFHHHDDQDIGFTKGAPETVIPLCEALSEEERRTLFMSQDKMASQGLRVLAVAMEKKGGKPQFLGFVALHDPPRTSAKSAIAECRAAHIRPIMITGDFPITAMAIGRELGIYHDGDHVMTGVELHSERRLQLEDQLEHTSIFARVSPEDKLEIIRLWKDKNEFVAMTGDGVNDAPALKVADVGIAIGHGTDVAKEASSLILTQVDFGTIVHAIREGRVIYDNIRKFIRYMLTTNLGEIITMLAASLMGLPVPLLPVQILWINLVTDGLPAIALGFEPAEGNVMRRGPRAKSEGLFARGLWQHILWVAALMGFMTVGVYAFSLRHDGNLDHARTIAFISLTLAQMGHVMGIRSETKPLWKIGLWSNYRLTVAVALTTFFSLLLVWIPMAQRLFHTTHLYGHDIGLCVLPGLIIYLTVEFEKWVIKNRS